MLATNAPLGSMHSSHGGNSVLSCNLGSRRSSVGKHTPACLRQGYLLLDCVLRYLPCTCSAGQSSSTARSCAPWLASAAWRPRRGRPSRAQSARGARSTMPSSVPAPIAHHRCAPRPRFRPSGFRWSMAGSSVLLVSCDAFLFRSERVCRCIASPHIAQLWTSAVRLRHATPAGEGPHVPAGASGGGRAHALGALLRLSQRQRRRRPGRRGVACAERRCRRRQQRSRAADAVGAGIRNAGALQRILSQPAATALIPVFMPALSSRPCPS